MNHAREPRLLRSFRACSFVQPLHRGTSCRIYWNERWCGMVDRETEQEIWRRVRQPGSMTAEEALLPEKLERMILEQKLNAEGLKALSARLSGPERQVFLRMAAENDNRARELTTLHYLLTGRRLRLKQESVPIPKLLPEALREAYFRQQQAMRDFRNLSREFSGYSELFERLGGEAVRQSRFILQTLQGKLG